GGSEGYGIRGSGNVPLIDDSLAMTLSGFFRHDPGVVDDPSRGKSDVDSADVWGARVSLLGQLTERFSARISATFQSTDGDGSSNVFSTNTRGLTAGLTQDYIAGTGGYERKVLQLDATLNYDLDWAQLTSITGYGDSKFEDVSDVTSFLGFLTEEATGRDDLGSITFLPSQTKKFSQELRLASHSGDKLEWLFGAFYTDEDSDTQYNIYASNPNTGALLMSVYPDTFPSTFQERAVFGAATYHFTDRFDIQVGARASRNEQYYEETIGGPLNVPPYYVQATSRDNSTTYLFSPRFRLLSDAIVYGRFATGYRPGGPNPGAGFGTPAEYGADTTLSYEVGVKSDFLERRVSLDASVYSIDWQDIQLQQRDPVTQLAYYSNAGKARSRGADLTALAAPARGMQIAASLSYNDAQLSQAFAGNLYGRAGDRLPFSAQWSGSLALDQELDLSSQYTAFFGGTATYLGARSGSFPPRATVSRVRVPSFTTLDLRAGVRTEGWTFSLFVRNATDARGILGAAPEVASGATGLYLLNVMRPRTIGLSVANEF
ncbi:TonB-dependent receptor, partial [Steroidobacter sp.]|uniref:TonB-dependent receptor n=1 Tax=Steroidobacter sp. TaxID=1978227 RepID=UPI001A61E819